MEVEDIALATRYVAVLLNDHDAAALVSRFQALDALDRGLFDRLLNIADIRTIIPVNVWVDILSGNFC